MVVSPSLSGSVHHFDYIDALRGYAILGVIAAHCAQVVPQWQGWGKQLVTQGQQGVQLFFVASAITLLLSWYQRADGMNAFYVRRLFRIAPMFWLGILFFSYYYGMAPRYWAPDGLNWQAVLTTVFFMHGWNPTFFNSALEGGWSIAVEMMFYLVFPILVYGIRGWKLALWAFGLALLAGNLVSNWAFINRSLLWPDISNDYLTWNLINLWFPSELPVFLVGFCVYFFTYRCQWKPPLWLINFLLFTALLAMLWLALRPDPWTILQGAISLYQAYGMTFGILAYALANQPKTNTGRNNFLVNFPIRYLGKISYSAYIWHFILMSTISGFITEMLAWIGIVMSAQQQVLFFCGFLSILLLITVIFSTLTYRFIELPMIRLGNRLIKSWKY